MKMLNQITKPFLPKDLTELAKSWPKTVDFVEKFYNPNEHSEPTLTEICEEGNEASQSQRFMTNKSLERKSEEMGGIFDKGEAKEKEAKPEKVEGISEGELIEGGRLEHQFAELEVQDSGLHQHGV